MTKMDKKPGPKPLDLTVRILEQIRDEMRHMRVEQAAMHAEQVAMRAEQAATNERLDALGKRQSEDAIRLSTEVVAVAKEIAQLRAVMRDRKAERIVLGDHEKRIRALERKSA